MANIINDVARPLKNYQQEVEIVKERQKREKLENEEKAIF